MITSPEQGGYTSWGILGTFPLDVAVLLPQGGRSRSTLDGVKLEKRRDQITWDTGSRWPEVEPGPIQYFADGEEITEAEYHRLETEQNQPS